MLNLKKDFPIFKNTSLTYFDNASTTQKPQCVIDKISEFYSTYNANIHRGAYSIAEKATNEFEKSRKIISKFINAESNEVVITKGATESINIIAYCLGMNFNEGDEIIISEMEHHSNILPWQMLIDKKKIKLKYIPLLDSGELDINSFVNLINKKTKLISIIHMSNVFGIINPIKKIIKHAKQNKVPILIDACQSIGHQSINVKELDCDFLVFSGHKIMGPTGVGVLYIKNNYLDKVDPFLRGGHMIKEVNHLTSTWNDPPWKFEAGTANIAQVIGLASSIDYIDKISYSSIKKHEDILLDKLLYELNKIDDITIYGHQKHLNSGPIVSLNIKGCHPYDIAKLLDMYGICIRAGHHCAQLLMKKFDINYTNRISLYLYNTEKEIDFFIKKLQEVINRIK
tara:strand:- start:2830 stop:4026 length:1197 start_codon:yes stop_codon:yes gene_type:complete